MRNRVRSLASAVREPIQISTRIQAGWLLKFLFFCVHVITIVHAV